MSKEMNIYQKIAILQDKIKVNKDNKNEFANFKYRTIQDMLSELKPNLKKLDLVIRFGAGKLDEDKYSLEIRVIDINNLENKIVESGEIYIDRTKSKMDLSQKVLSAKTFLKKSLLEDLLLLSEDDDPDGHDNTNNASDSNNSNTSKKKQDGDNWNRNFENINNKKATDVKKISDGQKRRMFAIAKSKNIESKLLEQIVKDTFMLQSLMDFRTDDYNNFTTFMEKNTEEIFKEMVRRKYIKLKIDIPKSLGTKVKVS